MKKNKGYVAYDLDGTLAEYWGGWNTEIGKPIAERVGEVKDRLARGERVEILTARVYPYGTTENPEGLRDALAQLGKVHQWCQEQFGRILPVSCIKRPDMVCLYDDRAVQVEKNTGRVWGKPEEIYG